MGQSLKTTSRLAAHRVNPLFLHRWSPRAYTGEPMPDDILFSAFEAARWAPSSTNGQPWRFLYSKRDSATWDLFLSLLNPNNQVWARRASALVIILSKKTAIGRDGQLRQSRTHSFEAGAAWQNFALQAAELGWPTHAIGGFDRDKTRIALAVPDDFAIEIAIAIGKQGEKSLLPPDLQERESPNSRLELKQIVVEGVFRAA